MYGSLKHISLLNWDKIGPIIFGQNLILVAVSSGKGGGSKRGWAVKSLVSAERAQ